MWKDIDGAVGGQCPKCHFSLNYGMGKEEDALMIYMVWCPHCGWTGKEGYQMYFFFQSEEE